MTKKDLVQNIFNLKSFLCVGLDPDPDKMPESLAKKGVEGILEFNRRIIDSTAEYAVAFKPNLAFYEVFGPEGLLVFDLTCRYIKENYSDKFIIADAKRGDIGNTARMYARSFFDKGCADAVTVAPYMGEDSVRPFLDFPGKWAVVLALTSNKGSEDFQTVTSQNGVPLFQRVIETACSWGSPENTMFVIGATRGELIAEARKVAPDHFFLVPGIGAQGGSLEDTCNYAMNENVGILVNSSRGIIHSSSGDDFAITANVSAKMLRDRMAEILERRFNL